LGSGLVFNRNFGPTVFIETGSDDLFPEILVLIADTVLGRHIFCRGATLIGVFAFVLRGAFSFGHKIRTIILRNSIVSFEHAFGLDLFPIALGRSRLLPHGS
jgi:hypothetical protein